MPPKRRRKTSKEPRKDVPKKPRKEVRKDVSIQIRATVEQKESLNEYATKIGQTLSGWMLTTCLQAMAAATAREADT